jgi:hypothetical protein
MSSVATVHLPEKLPSLSTNLDAEKASAARAGIPNDKMRNKLIKFLSTCSGEEIFTILNQMLNLHEIDILAGIKEYKQLLKRDVRAYLKSRKASEKRCTLTQQLIDRYGEIIVELRSEMSADKMSQYLEEFEETIRNADDRLERITPAMIRAAVVKMQQESSNPLGN